MGKITYFTIEDWSEHKVGNLQDLAFVFQLYDFIELAAR